MAKKIKIEQRDIGQDYEPFVIAEIGINHNGDFEKAKKMINDAYSSGAECVKFQCHIIDDEMIKNDVIPGNTNEQIWNIVERCSFTEEQETKLKKLTEEVSEYAKVEVPLKSEGKQIMIILVPQMVK